MKKIFILFVFLFFVCCLLPGRALEAQLLTFLENPLLNKQAPDFTLPTLSGQPTSLSQLRDGKSAILFFWATWCPHCRVQLKELSVMKADIEVKGIKVLLVDVGESSQQVGNYMKKNNINYEVFLDEDSKVSDEYNLIGVPTYFLIGADGVIKAVDHAIPSDYVEILTVDPKEG